MRLSNFKIRRPSADAPDPALASVEANSDSDSTLVVDAENGWAIGTAADLTEIDGDPVHNVLKRTEVWFGYKAAAVEKEATELAAAHADKGQPRHDLPRTEPLEMEVLLEQRAREVLSGWVDRVHRQLQGAIAAETEAIGTRLAAARRAVANASSARAILGPRAPLPDRVPALRLVRDTPDAQTSSVAGPEHTTEEIHAERHLKSHWFWPLMVLLMLADFFANHPVFVELFPANRLLDQGFSDWEERMLSDGLSVWHGFATMAKRALVYPEPSILAGVVVLLLLFLGHTCGGHLRTLVALYKHRLGHASAANAHAFRQAAWPAFGAVAGAVVIVGMLALARTQVLPAANERLETAKQELAVSQRDLQAAQAGESGESGIAEKQRAVATARGEVRLREERRSYANAIDRMNLAIAGLNAALVLAAILVGYLREDKRFSVVPRSAIDRAADRARKHADLSVEFGDRRAAAHQALDEVRAGILRIEHLLAVQLLRDWHGKAERLRGVVSTFRIENARLRGLDVADIAAFRVPVNVSFAQPDPDQFTLDRPSALDAYRIECARLQECLLDLDLDRATEINEPETVAAD
ncbi:MAG TPA: hypothetical protein VFT45_11770 [Longimicrobium sp.]|nr:hypothetical protein [Longimicrobium sp.]